MAKARGYPDRRGMGAQSDFIVSAFVPGERYRAEQRARVQALLAAGVRREELARMFSIAPELLEGLAEDEPAKTVDQPEGPGYTR